jgi:gluconate transporter
MTHAIVPPHPAPAVAAQLMGADVGRTVLFGTLLSIPLVIVTGIYYGRWIAKRVDPPIPDLAGNRDLRAETAADPPSLLLTISLLLLPVVLIFAGTLADFTHLSGVATLKFLGHSFSALLITALAAIYLLGSRKGLGGDGVTKLVAEAMAPLATLLLIIGGGGALKQILVDSGIGPYLGKMLATSPLSPLLVCFITATVLRIALGSATVAIVTAAGLLAPLLKQVPDYSPEMLVLSVCCGGTMVSHVNDAGFWLVKEYTGMTVSQTLRSWTVMKIIMGAMGILILLLWQTATHR